MIGLKFFHLLCLTLLTAMTRCAWGAPTPAPKSLPALHSRAEFDALARVTDTPYPLPHLLFVIDRQNGNRMYYADSKHYKFPEIGRLHGRDRRHQSNTMKHTAIAAILLLALTLPVGAAPARRALKPPLSPTVWPNSASRANSDPWLAAHHDQITQMRPRLLVLNFANGVSTPQATAQIQRLTAALAESSRPHGYADPKAPAFLRYELFKIVDLTDPDPKAVPPSPDGNSSLYPRDPGGPEGSGRPNFRYADLFGADFARRYGVRDPKRPAHFLTLAELVDRGLVHEVWFLAIQGRAGAPSETTELKQAYDERFHKIPNKWVQAGNALPGSEWPWTGRSLRVLFLNATRGPGCALESLSHSLEATANAGAVPYFTHNFNDYAGFDLDKRYGLPFDRLYGHSPYTYPDPTTLVYKRDSQDVTVPRYVVTGGNVHFCPSARQDYDLTSPFTVMSTIEHYGLRDGPGGKDRAGPWTVARFAPFKALASDCQGPWLVYWRQNMPGHASRAVGLDGRPAKNWWPFLFY